MGIVIFLVVIALVGGLVWWASAMNAKRVRELEEFAKSVGFAFEKGPFTPGGGPFVGAGTFEVFNQGYNRKITNVLHGRVDDAEVQIFDYQYDWSVGGRTGGVIGGVLLSAGTGNYGSRNRTTYMFTAAVFTAGGGTSFPTLQLYPEGFFSKIGSVFGGQDINFPEFPEFSKRFVLKSTDEMTVRAMFDQPTAGFFEAHQGVTVNAGGQYLVFYRANKRVKTADTRQFLDTAVYAYRTLAAAAARVRR